MTAGSRGKRATRVARIESLIGAGSEVSGNVVFVGGLHVDGRILGAVTAYDEENSTLILSELGRIDGDVRACTLMINGVVNGSVFAHGVVELGPRARVSGDVYYALLKMSVGAEVNGKMLKCGADELPG